VTAAQHAATTNGAPATTHGDPLQVTSPAHTDQLTTSSAGTTTPQASAAPLIIGETSGAAPLGAHGHQQDDSASQGVLHPAGPGEAAIAAAPDAASDGGAQQGGVAGMPMMGAMGGGAGGGGGDNQRGSGEWRATGNLFEDEFLPGAHTVAEGTDEADRESGW
jgi:hypothetical protein